MKLEAVSFLSRVRYCGEYLEIVRTGQGWDISVGMSASQTPLRVVATKGDRRIDVPASNCVLEYVEEVAPEAPKRGKK